MKAKNVAIGSAAVLGAAAVAGLVAVKVRRTIPEGAEAVQPFDIQKYLGKWYEVARLDYMFEKSLSQVSAHYSLNEDGTMKVVNRGYNTDREKWEEAMGAAKFVEDPDVGMLKISFFGPFYSGYNVIAIDDDYKYALVYGRNLDYLWLLSREKTMPKKIEKRFLKKAQEVGYDISKLVWTEQI